MGRGHRALSWGIIATAMHLSLYGCDRRREATGGAAVGSAHPQPHQAKQEDSTQTSAQKKPAQASKKEQQGDEGEAQAPPPPVPKYAELSTRWGSMELFDLGPAGPVTATPMGALFITHQDQMILAKRRSHGGFSPVAQGAEAFAKYGRGPAISQTHAYWASESGRLMRGELSTGKVQSIFDRARPATRTSVVTVAGRDVVAFVAQIDETPLAFLWASPGSSESEILQISPDGSSATSVEIVAGKPHPRVVVLEGRTSMSPVHVRTARVTPRRVSLEPDEVVWVGPGSHVLTEIRAIDTNKGDAAAFLPTAKDFHDFGLAQLQLDADGGEAPEPGWQIFPNGLDPAPVAAAHMCGNEYILFARPSEQRPRSPQELHLAALEGAVPSSGDLIARSRAFNDISLAPIAGGALAVWTADRRTWGMELTCPN